MNRRMILTQSLKNPPEHNATVRAIANAGLISLGLSLVVLASCARPETTTETVPIVEAPTVIAEESTPAEADAQETPDPAMATMLVNTEDGVAIQGIDPVAYFEQGAPIVGNPDYAYEWQDVTWWFASAEHRDQFANAPEQYAPQYGGYCAWAVSQGYLAPIDPNAWRIVEGKLYLNYNTAVQARWERDIPGHIAQADQNWPQLGL
jgi:YHS domain-containing protein